MPRTSISTEAPSPSRQRGFAAALILGSLAAGLLLVEMLLRLLGVSYPAFYRLDAHRGSALRPGAEGWFTREGRSYVRINRDGLRDRERDIRKPPGAYRVAILGDSMAEAMQVDRERAFPALLERDLSRCAELGGKTAEVLNFGVSGYGTAQELITLREHVWKYSPDLVVLAFFFGNDVRNNHPALNREPACPYFVFHGKRLDLEYPRGIAAGGWRDVARRLRETALDHSRVVQLYYEARRRMVMPAGGSLRGSGPLDGGEPGVDEAVFSPPRDGDWAEAWRVTETLLAMTNAEARAHGAGFRLLLLSSGIQVHPDPAARARFERRLGLTALFYPDERLESFAAQNGIPVIAPAEAMRAYAEARRVFLHGFPNAGPGFGHLNEAGHERVAEAVARSVCADAR